MKMGANNHNRVGLRFHPTDQEIVSYFLRNKVAGRHHLTGDIAEIELCQHEPWELPGRSAIQSDDRVWYFFCKQDQKYRSGRRANRTTKAGFWKATGRDRKVRTRGLEIGTKKTLVFYKGRVPTSVRTRWVMHEYRLTSVASSPNSVPYVVCCVKHKEEHKSVVSNFPVVEIGGDTVSVSKNSEVDSTVLGSGCGEDEHAQTNPYPPSPSASFPEVPQQDKPKSFDEFNKDDLEEIFKDIRTWDGLFRDNGSFCGGDWSHWMLDDGGWMYGGLSCSDLNQSCDDDTAR